MLFDKTVDGLTLAVHYSGLRHKVIANNIANIDTPGYKAMDISFRKQIERFIRERKSGSEVLNVSSLPPPTLILALYQSDQRSRIELNTVDIDQEQAKLAQNTILHNTYLHLLGGKFRTLRAIISGNA